MRVLFIAPYVPSPVRFRSYNFVRSLSALGHRVTILSAASGDEEISNAENLRQEGFKVSTVHIPPTRSMLNCLAALPTALPLQAVYSWSLELARRSGEMAFGNGQTGYDVVHVEHLRGSRYGLYLKSESARRGQRLPIVWDSVDCISLLFRQAARSGRQWSSRLLTRFELGRTEKYESYLLRQFRNVIITSPVDRQSILSLLPAQDQHAPTVSVIPIGVDPEYFRPDPDVSRLPATLVISGKMSYHANVAMVSYLVEDIMPRIWARRNDVKVVVVGKDPPPKLSALSRDPRIKITGTVKDIRPYLQSATLAVAPVSYGAGMQGKLLEAMACATPVVTTPMAIRALEGEPRRHLLVGENADDFADGVLRLLQDSTLRETIGRSGRDYVVETYPWNKVARRLADVYAEAINQVAA